MKTKIYALREDHWIKYVGKTVGLLEDRLAGHMREAGDEQSKSHKSRGIRKLLRQGILPCITLIEEAEGNGSNEEQEWIAYFRSYGIDLWNETKGGDGGDTFSCRTIESQNQTRKKSSRPQTLKQRQAQSQRMSNRVVLVKTRQRIQTTLMNHPVTDKARVKMSESHKELWKSPGHRIRMCESHKGQVAWNKGKVYAFEEKKNVIAANRNRGPLSLAAKESHRRGAKAYWAKCKATNTIPKPRVWTDKQRMAQSECMIKWHASEKTDKKLKAPTGNPHQTM